MTLTPRQKDQMVEALQAALHIVAELPASTPCIKCDHWIDNACAHWSAVPPEEVQAKGCDEFVDLIPF